jgi:hypothetical protein
MYTYLRMEGVGGKICMFNASFLLVKFNAYYGQFSFLFVCFEISYLINTKIIFHLRKTILAYYCFLACYLYSELVYLDIRF